MQRRGLVATVLAIMLLSAACSSDGDEAGLGSEAADSGTGAAADVEGVPSGCAAVLDVAAGPVDTDGNMTEERLEVFEESAEQARDSVEGESAATARYFQLIIELTSDLKEELKSDPDITQEQALVLVESETSKRSGEFGELAIETIAFLDRYCGTNLADPAAFGGSGANQDSDTGRPDDELSEDAVAMDDGDGGQDGDADGDDADAGVAITAEWESETESAGATGTYWGIDIEVGEVWRTNKDPGGALTGTDVGTDQSWVMVEVRLTNDRGGNTRVPNDAIRWLDDQGNLTAPTAVLTPQGNEWGLNFPVKSSERGYVVYPAAVGPTNGASLQVIGQNLVPETIPLGLGASSSPYPLSIPTGQTGAASYLVLACSYDVATDVREAEIGLNGELGGRWQRPQEGQRFVIIDLAITLVDSGGPNGCFPNAALFQLETRLELSNGDTVAPVDLNFEAVEKGATKVDQLVFPVADDVTSMTLKAVGGEVLAQWDDVTLPQP